MKSIVLLSGGIDSATALYKAKELYDGVIALTFDYEKWQKNELRAARLIARDASVKHIIVELPFYKTLPSSPSSSDADIIGEEKGISLAYVPARNLVFFGVAAAYAEVLGADIVVTGHNNNDMDRFPDVQRRFVETMNQAFALGLKDGKNLKISLPFAKMTKYDVLNEAVRLNVPLEHTWSCYNDSSSACGKCYGCLSRKDAFEKLGIKDPLEVIA
ncbi:MAG: 7-cyano-7-deazaguanine synthase QueC [Conexivisphaerales archaeon]